MPGGAPRTVSPPPEEMIKIGEEMIEWVNANNPLHLSEWYSIEKMILYKDWKAMIQLKEFLPYYEKALKMVARNYLNGNVAPAIGHRFIRAYFKDVKEEEDEQALFNSELRMKERAGSVPSAEEEDAFRRVMSYYSNLNSSDKTSNTPSKSACETGESNTCLGSES